METILQGSAGRVLAERQAPAAFWEAVGGETLRVQGLGFGPRQQHNNMAGQQPAPAG